MLPMFGKTRFTETTKEVLIEFWKDVGKTYWCGRLNIMNAY